MKGMPEPVGEILKGDVMAASTIVPLSEYLNTNYRPDCYWIDGEVKGRNLGERQLASVQKFLSGGPYQLEWVPIAEAGNITPDRPRRLLDPTFLEDSSFPNRKA